MTSKTEPKKKRYYVTYRSDERGPSSTCIALAMNQYDVRAYFACDKIMCIFAEEDAPDWMGEGKSYTTVECPHFDLMRNVIVRADLVAWEGADDARELLKAVTGVECVPCEGSMGRNRASIDYYEKYSGKGRTLVYEWEPMRGDRMFLTYDVSDNETWDHPTPKERFTKWLDDSPIGYNAWAAVENAACLVSIDGGTQNVWGEARALGAMSGIKPHDVLDFIQKYADDTYSPAAIFKKYGAAPKVKE